MAGSRLCGIVNYAVIKAEGTDCTWCYSSRELQGVLCDLCRNHILKKAYASLPGYLESLRHSKNYYDFSYLGGTVILIFDNTAIELCVHGLGLIQFRTINLWDIKIKEMKRYVSQEIYSDKIYFYDLSEQFELSFVNCRVSSVTVDSISYYPFSLRGFDDEQGEKSGEMCDLPSGVCFRLDSGVDFGIYADEMENFYIELKKSGGSV